ncbi:UNVERIFIED_CONTAM: hypothetical protein O8I53_08490 [Campylobacter lari]
MKLRNKVSLIVSIFSFLALAGASAYFTYKYRHVFNNDKKDENNNSSKVELPSDKTIFVRKPFGASFKLKGKESKPIVTIFNHFDSPDNTTRKNFTEPEPSNQLVTKTNGQVSESSLKKQGAQEVSEFLAIPEVLKYYDSLSPNSLILFGGDTNIKNENYYLSRLFKEFKDLKIESVLDYDIKLKTYGEKFKTSLGTKGNYANQYDKFFFINNTNGEFTPEIIKDGTKDFKIDIYKAFNGFVNKNDLKNKSG